jgi:hypothetical protein
MPSAETTAGYRAWYESLPAYLPKQPRPGYWPILIRNRSALEWIVYQSTEGHRFRVLTSNVTLTRAKDLQFALQRPKTPLESSNPPINQTISRFRDPIALQTYPKALPNTPIRSKKRAPLLRRGQSALVLSLCESLVAASLLLLRLRHWLRRSTLGGGLRRRLLRRTNG